MRMTLDELIALKEQTEEPVTVTHCGSSSKCKERFAEMQLLDTIAGKRVWTIGCNTKSDGDLAAMGTTIDKDGLDVLHLWKIDGSQEVLILDITDQGEHYTGESTRREMEYAIRTGKRIRLYSQEMLPLG
jgi:hypothetical protein